MKISRRSFVRQSSGLLLGLSSLFHLPAGLAMPNRECRDNKILVLIHLAGGNDWFNTIIPYRSSQYYLSRPTLAISSDKLLPLNDQYAFHPALSSIKSLYDQNKLAILLDVKNLESTLSHQRANKFLQCPNEESNISWQGRYAHFVRKNKNNNLVFPTINIQPDFSADKALYKDQIIISSLEDDNFIFDLNIHYKQNIDNIEKSKDYIENGFMQGMRHIANLIKQNHNATIYNISLGGFDTHQNQLNTHAYLLNTLSKAIAYFQNDLETNHLAHQVTTLICSEFGRSLTENDDQGTDHDHINHTLVIGNSIKGGIYGDQYLHNRHGCDYRKIYATILDNWLYCPSIEILGEKFMPLDFIKFS